MVLGCATGSPPRRGDYNPPYLTTVELRWPNLDTAGFEPTVVLDGSWLAQGHVVFVNLTGAVYSSFPAAARKRRRHPIVIVPQVRRMTDHAPVTFFNGAEFEIILKTQPEQWFQYAYQLSHELCHVLISSPAITDTIRWSTHLELPNRWMNEMLCQLAPFYVFPQLERTWRAGSPFPKAPTYARYFGSYMAAVRADATEMPRGVTF